MASKVNVTLNILLISAALILGNIVRLKVFPLNNSAKRSLGYHEDSLLNFTELSSQYGYMSKEHSVITEDGYVLTIFRMRGRRCKHLKKPPVILMHGLLQSSDAWLDAGPEAGLAYLIANACYDLWVGNQRGNYYSRSHVQLDPDVDEKFWQFSVDEIGLYDIPATIDYVLNYTNESKLNYVGYSQGAGTFFIMCSERPGYCDKANVIIALAPAARQTHTKSVIYKLTVTGIMELEGVLNSLGFYEFLAKGALGQEVLAFLCKELEIICSTFEGLFDSYHPGSIVDETQRVLSGHFPAGTSIHNMARYGQSMKTDRFQKFDYGKLRNLQLYGEERPPTYNLSAVTTPFVGLYGKNDNLVDMKDVLWLINRLPCVLEVKQVENSLWNHFDVTYSRHTRQMVFPKVDEYLQKYTRK